MTHRDKGRGPSARAAANRRSVSGRLRGFWLAALVALGIAILFAASAQAATVTVGSSLAGSFTTSNCGSPCTLINTEVIGPDAMATSPVNGAIVRWRVIGASAVAGYSIRVIRPAGGTSYTGAGTSAPQTPSGPALQAFAASLPIRAGDFVGIDTPAGGNLPINGASGHYAGWEPPLADGSTQPFIGPLTGELGFNADVQPAPGINLIQPASGPLAGGTSVTIAGHDFAGVSAVKFGSVQAISFTVESETKITAVAPPGATPGAVDTTVTTVAGTSEAGAADRFTYSAPAAPPPAPVTPVSCVVPKLVGKKLTAARKALVKASCKLGNVKGKKSKSAKVIKQNPKPGKVLSAGSKVNVKLGS